MDAPPPVSVEVGLGRRQARVLWGLSIGLVGVGGLVMGSLALRAIRSSDGVAIAPWIIGGVLLALGLLLVWGTPKLLRPRQLIVDQRGIRLADQVGKPFEVEWAELVQVRASYARKPSPLRTPLSWGRVTDDAAPDGTLQPRFGVSTFVRIDLVPADPGFLARHPRMKGYRRFTGRPAGAPSEPPWSEDVGDRQAVLRIPFGDQPELLAAVDHALRTHAGPRYHPPVNEGLALGFRYS